MKRVKENRDAFKGTGHTEIFIFNFSFKILNMRIDCTFNMLEGKL